VAGKGRLSLVWRTRTPTWTSATTAARLVRKCGNQNPLKVVYTFVCGNSGPRSICELAQTNLEATAGGDSGGPWYVDQVAYGVHSGGGGGASAHRSGDTTY
jgi:hypothetical protein